MTWSENSKGVSAAIGVNALYGANRWVYYALSMWLVLIWLCLVVTALLVSTQQISHRRLPLTADAFLVYRRMITSMRRGRSA